MAIQRIKLELIDHEDLTTQMRVDMDDDLVSEYTREIRNGKKFDPIEIMSQGNERYVVIDGHHRIRAHYKAKPKAKNIDAIVLPLPKGLTPERAAKEAALKVNLKHGQRLTNADKRNKCLVAWMLDKDSWEQSDHEIGRIAGVDPKTAASVRKELVKERRIPIRETEMHGEYKPSWLPISYISEQNVKAVFYGVEVQDVFRLAEKLGSLCKGEADAWSWNEEQEAIIHRGIEPGKTHSISLSANHSFQRGNMPSMRVIHELDGDLGDKDKQEAYAVLRASGDSAYRTVALELLEGGMGENHKDALRTLLEDTSGFYVENNDF